VTAEVIDVDSSAVRFTLVLPRVVLRPVSSGDREFLIGHWSDPAVRRFLFDGTPPVVEQIEQAIVDSARDFAALGYGLWLICRVPNDAPIGTVGLRPLDDLGLEVFYSLTPSVWGRGYATETARGVIDYALGPIGLTEVFAEVDEGNTASLAVIDRVGMQAFGEVGGVLGSVMRYRAARI
jgi:[ribosomal protein S5]-alanine N-acetyltransferase